MSSKGLLGGIPKSWDDKCFLGRDIFTKSRLDVWSTQGPQRLNLVKRLQASLRDCLVIKAWLDSAFSPSKVPVSYETINIFLDFYLKLSRDWGDALLFLNDERHKRDLGHLLDGSHLATRKPSRLPQPNLHFTRVPGNSGFKAISTDKAKSKILATEDEDNPRGILNSPTFRIDLSGHSDTQPHPIKRDMSWGPRSKNFQEESVPDTQREERYVTPGPSKIISNLDQTLEPLGNGSDGQKGPLQVDDAVVLKRRARSSPHPLAGRKKRKVAEYSEHSCRAKDETPNPSPPDARSTITEVFSNSITAEHLKSSGATPMACDKEPGPMYTPNEIPIVVGNGALTPSLSPGICVINSELCSGPPPQLDIEDDRVSLEEQHIKEAQDKSLTLTTPSIVDEFFDAQSQDSADEIHRELLNEHDPLDGHTMVTSTTEPLQVEVVDNRPMSPKREPSELLSMVLDDQLRSKLPLELYRMKPVPLDPPTGLVVKPVDPEIHFSSDNGPNLTICHFPKPKLPRLPPIWAESRQEVCETFDWFRSYQGGVYHADNTVKGYLLSAFSSRRDVFEHGGKLIISHGGGKADSTRCQHGLTVSHQASDQLAEDKSVRALLDNYRTGRPLVLLIDDKYVLFPYDLASDGVTYAVLGFYSIVYAWAEYQQAKTPTSRITRYKFAFRWCEEQGEPWWHQKSNDSPKPLSFPENSMEHGWLHGSLVAGVSPSISGGLDEPRKMLESVFCHTAVPISAFLPSVLSGSQECPVCRHISHQIYSSWVCLTHNCSMFWRNPQQGNDFLPDTLQYNVGFLNLTSQQPSCRGLRLLPPPAITRAMNGTSTGYAFTRGIHCPKCGRLSCRYQWEKLECMQCKRVQHAEIEIRFAKDFRCDRLPITYEHFYMSSFSDIFVEPMRTFPHDRGRGIVQTFTLPHLRGYLHHIRTNTLDGMKEADDIFIHYQEQARSGQLRFRRWPMRAHRCRGNLLTNYFSHNAGEPYHYVGGDANTVPFEQVPAVVEARTLIQKRTIQALNKAVEFNEVLSCAYMERQRMAFHSDAEIGLGPLVAGLSLGSPALMHFRLHARHDPLYERRGILLTVVLRHGDVLVMDGAEVQEYYEHTVVPNNFRIAATARQITPQHHNST